MKTLVLATIASVAAAVLTFPATAAVPTSTGALTTQSSDGITQVRTHDRMMMKRHMMHKRMMMKRHMMRKRMMRRM